MPANSSRRVPKYRHYRPKDLAVLRIGGKHHYLGKYGSAERKERYARLIAEHVGNGASPLGSPEDGHDNITISELIARYWADHVQDYYVKDGKPTDRQYHIKLALAPLRTLHGGTLAKNFGPRKLMAVRDEMVNDGVREVPYDHVIPGHVPLF